MEVDKAEREAESPEAIRIREIAVGRLPNP